MKKERQSNEPIGKRIKVLSEALGRSANKEFKALNLTMQQGAVLGYLKSRNDQENVTQKDVQNYLRVSHPTVVSVLKAMEQKGFIVTAGSDNDKRMKLVRMTSKAECSMHQIIEGRERMEAKLLLGFTEAEEKTLRDYLKRLYENIREE